MGRRKPKAALEAFKAEYGGRSDVANIRAGSHGEILVFGNTTLKSALPQNFRNTKVVFRHFPVRKTA